MKNAFYILAGVMVGFVLAGVLVFVSRAPAGTPITLQPAPTNAPIVVHVIGAVPRPGIYEFPKGSRIQNAIVSAGGLLAEASIDGINLAALLEDGQQLNIPYKSGSEPGNNTTTIDLPSSSTATPAVNPEIDLININTATLEELDSLPGIGPTTAQKIIDYRTNNGPFATIEDIMNVSGVGPSTFEDIKMFIKI